MTTPNDELGLERAALAARGLGRRAWRRRWPPVKTALCLLSLTLAILAGGLWALSTRRIDTLSLASRSPARVSAQVAPDGSALYDFDQTEWSAISFRGTVILRRSEAPLEAWTLAYLQSTDKLSRRFHHTIEPFNPQLTPALPRWHFDRSFVIALGVGFYLNAAERDSIIYIPWWLITGALLIAPARGLWFILKNLHGCPSCGYPRQGLAPDAPCPECGTASVRTL